MSLIHDHRARPDEDELADGKPHPGRRMTEEEFVAWCDEDTKAEWVDGEVIVMSPSSYRHVRIESFLSKLISEYAEGLGFGVVVGPEFMIRLGDQRRRRVPDLLFVAADRLHLLRANHLEGAPDWALEITSPESANRDRRDKHREYAEAGVREYWLVDPIEESVEAFELAGGAYRPIPEVAGRVASGVLPGFWLRPEWLWDEPRPRILALLRELGVEA